MHWLHWGTLASKLHLGLPGSPSSFQGLFPLVCWQLIASEYAADSGEAPCLQAGGSPQQIRTEIEKVRQRSPLSFTE